MVNSAIFSIVLFKNCNRARNPLFPQLKEQVCWRLCFLGKVENTSVFIVAQSRPRLKLLTMRMQCLLAKAVQMMGWDSVICQLCMKGVKDRFCNHCLCKELAALVPPTGRAPLLYPALVFAFHVQSALTATAV